VLEAGTNHPGELKPLLHMMAPRFGVVTNIGREHLEFFHDLVGVVREEGSIAECLPLDGVLFLNGDNPWSEILARRTRARVVLVGLDRGHDCVGQRRARGRKRNGLHGRLPLSGIVGRISHQTFGPPPSDQRPAGLRGRRGNGPQPGGDPARLAGLCAPAKMRLQMSNPGGIASWTIATTPTRIPCWRPCRLCANCRARAGAWRCWATWPNWEIAPAPPTSKSGGGRRFFAPGPIVRHWPRGCEIAAAARARGFKSVVEIDEVERAAQAVKEFARPGDVVLVKASRSMRLERITEVLRASCGNHHP
jgi:UDP-N-acetylmuramoyl-tripeptide--D-alanyl-D-alanine ligase